MDPLCMPTGPLMGQALMRPLVPNGPGPCGPGPCGTPGPLWAGPLRTHLGPCGPGPSGPGWALMGRAAVGYGLLLVGPL